MTPERWQQLKDLYAAAEPLEAGQREARLGAADPELAGLCRRLLAAAGSEGFLDRPLPFAEETATTAVPPLACALSPGDRLCERFDIVRFIARGGMGEVYEA